VGQRGHSKEQGIMIFFVWKGNESHQLRTGFFVQQRTVSEVMGEVFVSYRASYIVLRCRWCNHCSECA